MVKRHGLKAAQYNQSTHARDASSTCELSSEWAFRRILMAIGLQPNVDWLCSVFTGLELSLLQSRGCVRLSRYELKAQAVCCVLKRMNYQ